MITFQDMHAATKELRKRIQKERGKLGELQAQAADLRSQLAEVESQAARAESYLKGLEEALALIPTVPAEEKSGEVVLRSTSDTGKARDALAAAGHPLHIADLLSAMGKEDNPKNRNTVASAIRSYVRKDQVFTNSAPNTFGLKTWGTESPAPQHESPVFPEDEYDPFLNE